MKFVKIGFFIIALAGGYIFPEHAWTQYVLPQSVFGSGGAVISGSTHRIVGTVGQPAIGVASSSSHINEVGFWYQPAVSSAAWSTYQAACQRSIVWSRTILIRSIQQQKFASPFPRN